MCNLIIFPIHKIELCTKGKPLVALDLIYNRSVHCEGVAPTIELIYQLLTVRAHFKLVACVNRAALQGSQNCFSFGNDHRAEMREKTHACCQNFGIPICPHEPQTNALLPGESTCITVYKETPSGGTPRTVQHVLLV
uniref:Uncharacterized protein n=1 Tax=Cannabis sativa TaxID=3483 RepID=A0A803PJV7_CANSA